MARGLLIAAAVATGLLGLLWVTLSQQGATCEACMAFDGRRTCRSASAPSEDAARQHAIMTACALLTGGVTSDLACQRSTPESLRCR